MRNSNVINNICRSRFSIKISIGKVEEFLKALKAFAKVIKSLLKSRIKDAHKDVSKRQRIS